jgi:Sec63 Brl domain
VLYASNTRSWLLIATLTKHALSKLALDALRSLYFTDTILHSADCTVHINFTTQHSDGNYIAQNAARVARALFEITLRKGWSSVARSLLQLSKAIDRRAWWFQSPLRQFSGR